MSEYTPVRLALMANTKEDRDRVEEAVYLFAEDKHLMVTGMGGKGALVHERTFDRLKVSNSLTGLISHRIHNELECDTLSTRLREKFGGDDVGQG